MDLNVSQAWYQMKGKHLLVLLWDSEEREADLFVLEPTDQRDLLKVLNRIESSLEKGAPEKDHIQELKLTIEDFDEGKQNVEGPTRENPSHRNDRIPDLTKMEPSDLKELNKKIQNLLREISEKSK